MKNFNIEYPMPVKRRKNLCVELKVSGGYRLVVRKEDKVREDLEFDNLITDAGLIALYDTNMMAAIHLGTGFTQPQFTDTSLASWYAASTANVASSTLNTASAPYYRKYIKKATFTAGTFNNTTIREVGTASGSSSSSTICSRSLIKDALGNQVTVTLASDETLDVYYYLYVYMPVGDIPFSVAYSGTVYTGYIRPVGVANTSASYNWQLNAAAILSGVMSSARLYSGTPAQSVGDTTIYPTGTADTSSYTGTEIRIGNNLFYDVTWTFPSGNAIDFNIVFIGSLMSYNIVFDQPLNKTVDYMFSLSVRFSWGRYA